MATIDEKDVLDSEKLTELYRWIDAVPLTRTKKNIARDFSDGVPVAEIIHFYLPKTVDLHNYVTANSSPQKKINWNTLNRKVFTKFNMKLSENTLNQVIDAKPGAVEQVLWDLRCAIMNPSMTFVEKRELSFVKSSTRLGATSIPSTHAMRASSCPKSAMKSKPSNMNLNPVKRPSMRSIAQSSIPGPVDAPVSARPPIGNVTKKPPLAMATFPKEEEVEKAAESEPGQAVSQCNLSEVPSQIVFRGHKMVAVEFLEAKDREMKEVENSKKQLLIKITRLENLVQIKDQRIEDLSHQISNLRTMYENVTQQLKPFSAFDASSSEVNNNM